MRVLGALSTFGLWCAWSKKLGDCVCSKVGVPGILALLIHGDAAMSGLGIVTEAMQMSDLEGYCIGGSVHIVINNHVGFTTLPIDGRTSEHCTDTARAIGVPVIHVNADDPEAVVRAMLVAAKWRAHWHRDVIVDVCGYRCVCFVPHRLLVANRVACVLSG
jgi:multifunctional 2-oxoglutarate metabolism enzyme